MLDDNGNPLVAELLDCMYLLGLSRHISSITRFSNNGHKVEITKNAVTLYFGQHTCPVTIPLCNGINIASSIRIVH
jgi:hypothetical protein